MRFHLSTCAFAAAIMLGAVSTPALADETGMAGIHSWKRLGNKTCLVDHQHFAAGNGQTQQIALRDAVRSWESFTDLEYGSTWAAYAQAIEKNVSCGRNLGDISCSINATPCKVGVGGQAITPTSKRRRARSN